VKRPWLVPVGGFLGAGKTTLILAAARQLGGRGIRTAAIFNDQGDELVDTAFARRTIAHAGEVTGGCFCCRFSDLLQAAEALRAYEPQVIFAEPVGSCTDLAVTVIRPLQSRSAFEIAPLTVIVDPAQAADLLSEDADPHLSFLFRNQLAEADLVCFNKADIHSSFPDLSNVPVRYLSARTGQGIEEWLAEIFSGRMSSGTRPLSIDYERYARAEAALAWLNWRAELLIKPAASPALVVGPLLDDLQDKLSRCGIRIAHLKLFDTAPSGYLKAAVTGTHAEPSIEGDLTASPAERHDLVVNLRALADPGKLERVFMEAVNRLPGKRNHEHLQCFQPAPPVPEIR
jgi:Ni2+-binding GTPase involved in maturation of urease and hydrogenase